jgi:hypothetical protein
VEREYLETEAIVQANPFLFTKGERPQKSYDFIPSPPMGGEGQGEGGNILLRKKDFQLADKVYLIPSSVCAATN